MLEDELISCCRFIRLVSQTFQKCIVIPSSCTSTYSCSYASRVWKLGRISLEVPKSCKRDNHPAVLFARECSRSPVEMQYSVGAADNRRRSTRTGSCIFAVVSFARKTGELVGRRWSKTTSFSRQTDACTVYEECKVELRSEGCHIERLSVRLIPLES